MNAPAAAASAPVVEREVLKTASIPVISSLSERLEKTRKTAEGDKVSFVQRMEVRKKDGSVAVVDVWGSARQWELHDNATIRGEFVRDEKFPNGHWVYSPLSSGEVIEDAEAF